MATLQIADHIAAGVTDIGELATAADCDPVALHSVLGYLVGKGVFEEPAPGRFALNEAARRLRDPSTFLDLTGIGGRMAYSWSTLLTYVRTGKSAYHEVFGRTFWEDLAAHPEVAADFDALMGPAGHGTPDPQIEITGAGSRYGPSWTWAVAPAPCSRRSSAPSHGARHPGRSAGNCGTRGRDVGGGRRGRPRHDGRSELLRPAAGRGRLVPAQQGAQRLPDEQTIAILRRSAQAASPHGRVVVLGGVSPEDTPCRLTIDMVLVGGTTNTITELRELAREAGLDVVAAGRQASGRFVVECRPSRPG